MALIDKLNKDPKINGILVQLPLPKHLDESQVLLAIDPDKDVDGFHPVNVGKMVVGEEAFLPCTPHGVIQLLLKSNVKIEGAEVRKYVGSCGLVVSDEEKAYEIARFSLGSFHEATDVSHMVGEIVRERKAGEPIDKVPPPPSKPDNRCSRCGLALRRGTSMLTWA